MRIDFKGYTPKQYAVLILRQDLKYSIREISERMGYSQSGVRYILSMKK
jgi:DNA-binding MarR family transcriptional regulator